MAKKKPAQRAKVTYVDFPSATPITIDDPNYAFGESLMGRFVKYAPTLPAEARNSFDAAAMRAKFLAAGAVGVVVTPRFVGIAKTREVAAVVAKAATKSAEAAFEAWLGELRGVSERRLKLARGIFHSINAKGRS